MKKMSLLTVLTIIFLSGCSYSTWQCQHYICQSMTYDMAVNKCAVVANTSRSGYPVWEQCMRSYGYIKIHCNPEQYNENPCFLELQ